MDMKDCFIGFMISNMSILSKSILKKLALYGGETITNDYSYISPLLTKQEKAENTICSTA